jgi:hypothetical protein
MKTMRGTSNNLMEYLKDTLQRLQVITKDCRDDMHEPDQQGIKASVIGNHLDNAFGDSILPIALDGGYQEFVVTIDREDEETGEVTRERFNLANLIALAKLVKL